MLKLIDPILNADVLHAMRAMGHGDDLVICDINFPANSVGRRTTLGHMLRLENVDSGRVARAILSLFPLDTFVDQPVERMQVVGHPDELLPVHTDVQREVDAAEGRSWPMGALERFAFYERAKQAYCVIQTGEQRGYGCFIFKKGVIQNRPV